MHNIKYIIRASRSGNRDLARRKCYEALTTYPDHAVVRDLLGLIQKTLQSQDALAAMSPTRQPTIQLYRALHRIAAAVRTDDTRAALKAYAQADESLRRLDQAGRGRHPITRLFRGLLYRESGNIQDAVQTLETFRGNRVYWPVALRFICEIDPDKTDADLSPYYNLLLDTHAEYQHPIGIPGDLLKNDMVAKVNAARFALRQCMDTERFTPRNPTINRTQRLLETVSLKHRDNANYLAVLGTILMETSQLAAAEATLKHALQMEWCAETAATLAELYNIIGYPDHALEMADRAFKEEPETSRAVIQKGVALLKLGRSKEAVTVIRAGVRDNRSPDNVELLGRALIQSGIDRTNGENLVTYAQTMREHGKVCDSGKVTLMAEMY